MPMSGVHKRFSSWLLAALESRSNLIRQLVMTLKAMSAVTRFYTLFQINMAGQTLKVSPLRVQTQPMVTIAGLIPHQILLRPQKEPRYSLIFQAMMLMPMYWYLIKQIVRNMIRQLNKMVECSTHQKLGSKARIHSITACMITMDITALLQLKLLFSVKTINL